MTEQLPNALRLANDVRYRLPGNDGAEISAELHRLHADGPIMQRGTDLHGNPVMGTMRQVMEDYRMAAEAEAQHANELRAELSRLHAKDLELEKLCDETYVAQGADAYDHACSMLEDLQAKRRALGLDPGCVGSLCDGLAWIHDEALRLQAESEALRDSVAAKADRIDRLGEMVEHLQAGGQWCGDCNRKQCTGPCSRKPAAPADEVGSALKIATEYRPTMTHDVLHSWAHDAVMALRVLAALASHPAQAGSGVPQGWRLVPEAATREMLYAGFEATGHTTSGLTYRAMLAAAPTPPQAQPAPVVVDEREIERIVRSVCNSDPFDSEGNYCLTPSEVGAILQSSRSGQDDGAAGDVVAVTTAQELGRLKSGPGSIASIFPANAKGFLIKLYTTPQPAAVPASRAIDRIRAMGWSVAVHNDYRLNGEPHTFWLFTKDGIAVKGEGRTDAEALTQVSTAIAANKEAP